jgi:hypothetical protein
VPSPAKGVPARFVSVGPAAAAKASSEGWRLCLRPNMYHVCTLLLVVWWTGGPIDYSISRHSGMAAKIRETVVTTHSPESFNYPGDPTICEQECRIATNKVLVASYKRKIGEKISLFGTFSRTLWQNKANTAWLVLL